MFSYSLDGKIATITMDDGKANAVSSKFLEGMNAQLDQAEADKAKAVILKGRDGMFSAGFDLKELAIGPKEQLALVLGGFRLLLRMFTFSRPLVAACNGHGIGMGAFLLMSCDTRISGSGSYKFSLPETAIGMELNPLLVAVAKNRICNRFWTRTAIQSENLTPELAVEAGIIDQIVAPDAVDATAQEIAEKLAALPSVYGANKRHVRANAIADMEAFLASVKE